MKMDLLAIGELLGDAIATHQAKSLEDAKSFDIFQGGSAANVAANVQYLGKQAALIACVGDDGIGRQCISALQHAGVDTSLIQVNDTLPTSLVLVSSGQGSPEFIAYRMADAHITHVDDTSLQAATMVHTNAFALSKEPARSAIIHAVEKSAAAGKIISIDWNFAPAIWHNDDGKAVFETLMKLHPLVKISYDDVQRFYGQSISVDEAKDVLQQSAASLICFTCGKDGVHYKEGNQPWQYQPALPADVIDTTGAGDAFWAGFLVAWFDHQPTDHCIENALRIAAQKISRKGPMYGG